MTAFQEGGQGGQCPEAQRVTGVPNQNDTIGLGPLTVPCPGAPSVLLRLRVPDDISVVTR